MAFNSHSKSTSSSKISEAATNENIVKFMNDHDVCVIDEALLEAEKAEYIDHFGVRIQAKQDTEYDPGTSDSEFYEDASTTTTFATSSALINHNKQQQDTTTTIQRNMIEEIDAIVEAQRSKLTTSSAVTNDENDNQQSESIVLQQFFSTIASSSSLILNQPTAEEWQLVSSNGVVEKLNSNSFRTVSNDNTISPYISAKASPAPVLSYYGILLSKFSRSNTTDQDKQTQLKQETSHNLELLKEQSSKGETDWEFWASVISDFDKVNKTEQSKFKSLLSIGIPSSLRGLLWQIFCDSKTNSELIENEYRELLEKPSPQHEKLIKRDLPRTFPTLDYFKDSDGEGQEMLFNVIKAYSLFDTHVGYCQGLHFVVGILLLHMPDEAAFCVLIKLMSHYNLRGHFTPQMETLHERMYQFNQLLLLHLPQVHRHLDAQGVLPNMYASQWFMTLFAYRCPLELVYRIFDFVFVEGSHIVIAFALALMKKNQQLILSLEFESLLGFFSGGSIFDVYKDDAAQFVRDAYSFDITPKFLQRLSKQYQHEAAKEAKIQSIEYGIKRENLLLTEQIKKLRQSYKTLEIEHQDVAQQVIDAKMSMASLAAENQQLKHELSQLKSEITKIKMNLDEEQQYQFNHLAQQNAHLTNVNTNLEDRLNELETALIDMKLKYAESENDYDMMKQKLHEAQRLTSLGNSSKIEK